MNSKIKTYIDASQKVSHRLGRIVPCLGTHRFMPWDASFHALGRIVSLLLLFLMLVLGGGKAWAQDYSGTYYIGSLSNQKNTPGDYYLCPTKGWYLYKATDSYENDTDDDDDNGKPFLTTYQCKDGTYDISKAVWTIKKNTDKGCYYIIQKKTGRYLVSNGKINGSTSARRMRVHLEEVADENALNTLGDKALFEIIYHAKDPNTTVNHLDIIPHSSTGRNGDSEQRLVVNFKNFNILKASGDKTDGPNGTYGKGTGGIIGVYSTEPNEQWALETPNPSFYLNATEDELSVVGDLAFYYTTDGEDPEVSGDGSPGNESTTKYTGPISLDGINSIKYIVTSKDGHSIKSSVITYYKYSSVEWEGTGVVYNGTAQVPTVSSITINEESKTVSDFTIGAKNNVNAGTAILTFWDEENGIYAEKPFTIAKRTTELEWPAELPYTNAAQTPVPTITNLVTGDECAVTVSVTGEAIDMGTYTATATGLTGSSSGNYQLPDDESLKSCSFDIVAATLTVTADNKTKVYGEADPEFTYTGVTGFVGDDTADLLSGSLSRANVDNQNVGEYAITAGTLSAGSNYVISVSDAKLTITPAPLTITADNLSKNYGEDDPVFTFSVGDGELKYEDTKEIVLSGALTRETGELAGTYAINQGTLAIKEGNNNYTISSFTAGTFTIIGEALSLTVNLDDWVYGSPKNPSVSGNAGGGKVTYTYKYQSQGDDKYTTTKPKAQGNYTVRAQVPATGSYEAATATKNFKITKLALKITADSQQKDYLDNDPELTYTANLKYDDKLEDVVECELERAAGETVGEYAITIKNGTTPTLKSNNYSYNTSTGYTGANLTIAVKNLGNGGTPASGLTISAKKEGNTWTVKLFNGTNQFAASDFTHAESGSDTDGYTITVTGQGTNCSGSATASYNHTIFDSPIIVSSTEKAVPYYVADNDVKTSLDVVPCIVSQVNTSVGTISITPISYIPEGVPVLLLAKNEVTGLTSSPLNEGESSISESLLSSNKLMYSAEETVDVHDAEAYLYYRNEFVLTLAGTIKAQNYYIYNPNYSGESTPSSPAPSRTLSILKGDGITGIMELNYDKTNEYTIDRWYLLDGRLLNGKPSQKGIYIKNGKKTVVK